VESFWAVTADMEEWEELNKMIYFVSMLTGRPLSLSMIISSAKSFSTSKKNRLPFT